MKANTPLSCPSTYCPNTSDVVDESVFLRQSTAGDTSQFIPSPLSGQIEGPSSSVIANGWCPTQRSCIPLSSMNTEEAVPEVSTSCQAPAISSSCPPVTPEDCTLVESVFTGQSVVPPPETFTSGPPDCAKWAGAAFGEAVAHEVPVSLVQEKIVYKPVKQIVHRPVEKTTYVPKVIRKEVAEFRQVMTDEVIEVPKSYPVETRVFVPNYVDHKKHCVIAQKYIPVMGMGTSTDVECAIYQPDVRVVNVKVPKIVGGYLQVKERHTRYLAVDNLSKAQWNTLIFKLNPDLCSVGDLNNLPVHRGPDGSVIAFKTDVPVGVALD